MSLINRALNHAWLKQVSITFRMRLAFGLTAALLCLPLTAETIHENAAATGFQLLDLPVNGRLIAMGSAGTAMPGWGFSYYNPAMPFLTKRPYVVAEYSILPWLDLHRGHFETAWPIGKFFLAGSMTTASILNIYPATIQGVDYNAPGSAQLTTISLNGGYEFVSNAALAISINGIQDRIMTDAAYLLTVSLGAVWQPIRDKLTIGLAATHFAGSSTSYLDTTEHLGSGADWPVTVRGGISWQDRLKSIDYGAAVDLVYRKVDGQFMVPVGLEVWPLHSLALRVGKRFYYDSELMDFGIGLRFEPVTVDVAFVIPQYVGDYRSQYTVSLCYTLRDKPAAKKSAPPKAAAAVAPQPIPRPDTTRAPASTIDTTAAKPAPAHPADSSIAPSKKADSTAPDTSASIVPVDTLPHAAGSLRRIDSTATSVVRDSAATKPAAANGSSSNPAAGTATADTAAHRAAPIDTNAAQATPARPGPLPAVKQP
jgi:hypothetical protein